MVTVGAGEVRAVVCDMENGFSVRFHHVEIKSVATEVEFGVEREHKVVVGCHLIILG